MLKKYKKARGLPLSGVISYYPVTVIRIALAQEETGNQQDGIEFPKNPIACMEQVLSQIPEQW